MSEKTKTPQTFEHFLSVLRSYGETDEARAKRIGLSRRTIIDYRNGNLPERITRWPPELLRALACDLELAESAETHA